jgi:S-adenosylmethionine/arginine decarboxylase-like enzyme
VDIFTCGDDALPTKASGYIIDNLQPETIDISEQYRGVKIFEEKACQTDSS